MARDRETVQHWLKKERALAARLADHFQREWGLSEAAAHEAAFHMSDWLADLADLHQLFQSEDWDHQEAKEIIRGFVVHAPAHIAAAALILHGSPVEDIFQLGAVKGSGQPSRMPGGEFPDRD